MAPETLSAEKIAALADKTANGLARAHELVEQGRWPEVILTAGAALFVAGAKWAAAEPEQGLAMLAVSACLLAAGGLLKARSRREGAVAADLAGAPPPPRARSALKGLRPFQKGDRHIFTRLQRKAQVRELADAVADDSFRWGVLCAPTGSGKTSLLQAGLRPELEDEGFAWVYVALSGGDCVEEVRRAVGEARRVLPEEGETLASLLARAAEGSERGLVLVLDQFEQVFLQAPGDSSASPLLQELAGWYRGASRARVLASIRADFYHRMIEVQRAIGRRGGRPGEVFSIPLFRPDEMAGIIEVIAETEQIGEVDREFVTGDLYLQLATRPSEGISPVEIQIYSCMVNTLPPEHRAFDRQAFERLDGVEGLMERFLRLMLAYREDDRRRMVAEQVLLALVNREEGIRAAPCTLGELLENAELRVVLPDAPREEIAEALEWLCSPSVCLVLSSHRQAEVRYELAHDRLVRPVRRVTGKAEERGKAARLVLERRYREWTDNDRAPRCLLRVDEWRQIEKDLPPPVLDQAPDHRTFLRRSKRRTVRLAAGAAAGIVLMGTGGIGWAVLANPEVTLYEIEGKPPQPRAISHDVSVALVRVSRLKGGEDEQKENVALPAAVDAFRTVLSRKAGESFAKADSVAGMDQQGWEAFLERLAPPARDSVLDTDLARLQVFVGGSLVRESWYLSGDVVSVPGRDLSFRVGTILNAKKGRDDWVTLKRIR